MTYTVRYRGKDGEGEFEIEAEDRAGVFKELKRRGVQGAVLGVAEGKGTQAKAKPRRGRAAAVMAALALAAGVGVWRWQMRGRVTPQPKPPVTATPTTPQRDMEERGRRPSLAAAPQKPKAVSPAADGRQVSGSAAEKNAADPREGGDGVPPGHIMLPTGQVLKYNLPPEGKTRKLIANGEVFEVYHDGLVTNISPKPLFQKPFERTLAVLAYPDDGILMMEDVRKMTREDVLKWCREPTGYYDDDTEEDLQKRKTVADMKAAVLEYLEGGGDFAEYAEAARNFNREELAFHTAGLHEITAAIREGRLDDAKGYLKEVNAVAKENGYRDLILPGRYKALLEASGERP